MSSIISVKNVSYCYDHRLNKQALSSISFEVHRGEWVAIAGHNGSGKSTLAKLLVGLLEPDEGSILIAGIPLLNNTKWVIRQHIGVVFQNPDNQFVGTTVQDDVAFALENNNVPREIMRTAVDAALALVGMSDFRLHDPSKLSGGQKQRVALAGILALKPEIILLDEALVMLDPQSRQELLAILQRLRDIEDITLLSVTHDMNEAAMADRMIVMKQGQIAHTGEPAELFSMPGLDLEMPYSEQLRRALKKRGISVPQKYMSEKELVKWLCK